VAQREERERRLPRLRAERAVLLLLTAQPRDAARDGGVDPRLGGRPRVGFRRLRLVGAARIDDRRGGGEREDRQEPARNSHRRGS
jgi:hypothetical protein